MKMEQKIKALIIGAFLSILGLCAIQYYLIRNTYELEKRNFTNQLKEELSDVEEIEALKNTLSENLSVEEHIFLNQTDYKKRVHQKIDSLNRSKVVTQLNDFLQKKFHYNIRFGIQADSLEYFRKNTSQENYFAIKDISLIGKKPKKGDYISLYNWTSESAHNDSNDDAPPLRKLDREKSEEIYWSQKIDAFVFVEIESWKNIVLKKMTGIFLLAFSLILAVILVSYFTINNLIRQKKIADIRTDFANNVTHELKTPLAALSVAVQSLKNKKIQSNEEVRKDIISLIDRQNIRLQKITDKILESSFSDDVILKKEKIEAFPFLEKTLEEFKLSQEGKTNIEWNISIENSSDIFLEIDPTYFANIITNLLDNAVKYSEGTPRIRVKSLVDSNDFILEISDKGIGIPQTEQQQIFDKFYRVKKGNRHDVKGLGLGLYQAKTMMEKHGGSLEVSSKIGEGSRFILKLPKHV